MVKLLIVKKERKSGEISSAGTRVFETVSSYNPVELVVLAIGVITWLNVKNKMLVPSKPSIFEPKKSKWYNSTYGKLRNRTQATFKF